MSVTIRRTGATLIELALMMTIAGVTAGLAVPRLQSTISRVDLRAATGHVANAVATARLTAANRGCNAVLHLDGSTSRVWITTCRPTGTGIDTVGSDYLSARFKVALSSSADSIRFLPSGTRADWTTTSVRLTHSTLGASDSLRIDALGRVIP